MATRLIRYLAYLVYLALAGAAWLAIAVFAFGFVPAPHERACDLQPDGCPPASLVESLLGMAFVFSIVPLTVLGFVLLRGWLHRMQSAR